MPKMPLRRSWGSLTSALDETRGPARRLLDAEFPHRAEVQRAYRDDVGSQLVLHRTANPGTLGGAFDAWMQMQVTPRPEFDTARRGARVTGDVLSEALDDLLACLGPPRSTVAQRTTAHRGPWTGPTSTLNDTEVLCASWAIACLTEVYRAGLWPDSPLMSLPDRGPVDLLEMAGEDALDELRDLTDLARRSLLPVIRPTAADAVTHVAPTFSGSELMNADADLIVDGALVEMKTAQGIKTSAGRRATLTGITLCQLLGYVLHDNDDAYGLHTVALYQARYGHLARWRLQDLLDELAGHPVDLPDLRQRWRSLLLAGPASQPRKRARAW
jgi:hypothetical protein